MALFQRINKMEEEIQRLTEEKERSLIPAVQENEEKLLRAKNVLKAIESREHEADNLILITQQRAKVIIDNINEDAHMYVPVFENLKVVCENELPKYAADFRKRVEKFCEHQEALIDGLRKFKENRIEKMVEGVVKYHISIWEKEEVAVDILKEQCRKAKEEAQAKKQKLAEMKEEFQNSKNEGLAALKLLEEKKENLLKSKADLEAGLFDIEARIKNTRSEIEVLKSEVEYAEKKKLEWEEMIRLIEGKSTAYKDILDLPLSFVNVLDEIEDYLVQDNDNVSMDTLRFIMKEDISEKFRQREMEGGVISEKQQLAQKMDSLTEELYAVNVDTANATNEIAMAKKDCSESRKRSAILAKEYDSMMEKVKNCEDEAARVKMECKDLIAQRLQAVAELKEQKEKKMKNFKALSH